MPSHPRILRFVSAAALVLFVLGPQPIRAETQAVEPAAVAAETLPNGRAPLPGVITGGEPGLEDLQALADAGYHTLISLRTDGEGSAIGAPEAEEHGMRYASIPVAGAEGLTRENVEALDRILDDPETGPVVLFCGSGNRVGALLALRAAWLDGASPEEALELGRAAGLTRLEPAVRAKLGLPEG